MDKKEKCEMDIRKLTKYILIRDNKGKEVIRGKINFPVAICNDLLCIEMKKGGCNSSQD